MVGTPVNVGAQSPVSPAFSLASTVPIGYCPVAHLPWRSPAASSHATIFVPLPGLPSSVAGPWYTPASRASTIPVHWDQGPVSPNASAAASTIPLGYSAVSPVAGSVLPSPVPVAESEQSPASQAASQAVTVAIGGSTGGMGSPGGTYFIGSPGAGGGPDGGGCVPNGAAGGPGGGPDGGGCVPNGAAGGPGHGAAGVPGHGGAHDPATTCAALFSRCLTPGVPGHGRAHDPATTSAALLGRCLIPTSMDQLSIKSSLPKIVNRSNYILFPPPGLLHCIWGQPPEVRLMVPLAADPVVPLAADPVGPTDANVAGNPPVSPSDNINSLLGKLVHHDFSTSHIPPPQ